VIALLIPVTILAVIVVSAALSAYGKGTGPTAMLRWAETFAGNARTGALRITATSGLSRRRAVASPDAPPMPAPHAVAATDTPPVPAPGAGAATDTPPVPAPRAGTATVAATPDAPPVAALRAGAATCAVTTVDQAEAATKPTASDDERHGDVAGWRRLADYFQGVRGPGGELLGAAPALADVQSGTTGAPQQPGESSLAGVDTAAPDIAVLEAEVREAARALRAALRAYRAAEARRDGPGPTAG